MNYGKSNEESPAKSRNKCESKIEPGDITVNDE
jgi:hypothetical protein